MKHLRRCGRFRGGRRGLRSGRGRCGGGGGCGLRGGGRSRCGFRLRGLAVAAVLGKGHNAALAGGDGRSRIGLGAVGDGVGLRLLGQVQIDAARFIRHNALQAVALVRGQGPGCDGGVCHRLVVLIRQLDDCLVQGLLSVGDGGANGGCSVRSGAAAIVRSCLAASELQAAAGDRNYIGSHGIAAAAACRLFCTGGAVAADDGYRAAGDRQSVCPNAVGLGAALKRQAPLPKIFRNLCRYSRLLIIIGSCL